MRGGLASLRVLLPALVLLPLALSVAPSGLHDAASTLLYYQFIGSTQGSKLQSLATAAGRCVRFFSCLDAYLPGTQ